MGRTASSQTDCAWPTQRWTRLSEGSSAGCVHTLGAHPICRRRRRIGEESEESATKRASTARTNANFGPASPAVRLPLSSLGSHAEGRAHANQRLSVAHVVQYGVLGKRAYSITSNTQSSATSMLAISSTFLSLLMSVRCSTLLMRRLLPALRAAAYKRPKAVAPSKRTLSSASSAMCEASTEEKSGAGMLVAEGRAGRALDASSSLVSAETAESTAPLVPVEERKEESSEWAEARLMSASSPPSALDR